MGTVCELEHLRREEHDKYVAVAEPPTSLSGLYLGLLTLMGGVGAGGTGEVGQTPT